MIDRELTFSLQKETAKGVLTKKWNLLVPFIRAGLKPVTAKALFMTIVIPKVFHNAFIWDPEGTTSTYKCMKDIINAKFNPPAEALLRLLDIPPPEIRNKTEMYAVCRMCAADNSISKILE